MPSGFLKQRGWVKTIQPRCFLFLVLALLSSAILWPVIGPSETRANETAGSDNRSSPFDVTLIVDRKDSDIELYFGLPAESATAFFASPKTVLVDDDGLVTFDSLREGTWDAGDDLMSNVQTWLDGREVQFEAMSIMVHPIDQRAPFFDPLDGLMAVSICTAIIPGARLPLESLYLYAGYIGYVDDSLGPLQLNFASTGRGSVQVDLRLHENGVLVQTQRIVLQDGGVLVLG